MSLLLLNPSRRAFTSSEEASPEGLQTILTLTRVDPSGSGEADFHFGFPTIIDDPTNPITDWSLWRNDTGNEISLHIKDLTGETSDGRPLSRRLQFRVNPDECPTVTLKFDTPPLMPRLEPWSITFPTIDSPNGPDIYAPDPVLPSNNIRNSQITGVEGIFRRPSSEFCKWEGFGHPLRSWGSYTPTAGELARRDDMMEFVPYLYSGIGQQYYQNLQYGKPLLEVEIAATEDDEDALIRFLKMGSWARQRFFLSSLLSSSDSIGSFNYTQAGWTSTLEPYFMGSTGAMLYLFLDDETSRDIGCINFARAQSFKADRIHYILAEDYGGNPGDHSLYNVRTIHNGLHYAAWACMVGAKDIVYNGQTGLAWTREIAANLLLNPAIETMGVGKRYRGNYFGTTPEYTLFFQVGLLLNQLIMVDKHPTLGGTITGLLPLMKDLVDYAVDEAYIAQAGAQSPCFILSDPEDLTPAVDLNMWWVNPLTLLEAEYPGNGYGDLRDLFTEVCGREPHDGTTGPWIANQNNTTNFKNLNENFLPSINNDAYERGGWE